MGYSYPIILVVGIIIIAIAFLLCTFLRFKRKKKYTGGKKVANTQFIRESEIYKKIISSYRIWCVVLRAFCAIAMAGGVVLLAQPYVYEVNTYTTESRDIFLCMDISTTVDELNENLVKQFQDNTWQLEGEQFGISIFNTSSVLLVPLTTDYVYVNDVFDKITTGLDARKNPFAFSSYEDEGYINDGTLENNSERGSSIIGDGLASCVCDFQENKDGERTQIIILTTDNDVQGTELIDLPEAAQMAAERGITVYGIAPEETAEMMNYDDNIREMQAAVESTGGSFYIASSDSGVKEVLKDIQKKEGSPEERTETTKSVKVFGAFLLLLFGVSGMALTRKKVTG